jgi:hypothetical protein
MKRIGIKKQRVNHQALALAVKRMMEGPTTAHNVVEVTGLHINTAYELMRTFHDNKVVHISGWEPNALGVDTTPIFTLGAGRDVKRRKASSKERSARSRRLKKEMQVRDPLVAALHGEFYDYRGFKVIKGVTVIVDHPDPYFKTEGYPSPRAAHGVITRFINSRGIKENQQ